MCGIAGVLDCSRTTRAEELQSTVAAMAATLHHRGPDDEGTWIDADAGLALGSRRLAIIDLSDAGAQPMVSSSGRHVICFNGEVYNYRELARQLADCGRQLRGHSDTEVLVEAIDEWGLTETLARANGMFAFAVWDRHRRRLHLARDRMGEKPLYYGRLGSVLAFGSELKALRVHPAFRAEVDRGAVALFLRFKYVPAPWTIYRGIHKLPPATVLTVDPSSPDGERAEPYWSALAAAEAGARSPRCVADDEAIEELEALLRDATRLRMRSDVPLGAFLSGGVDSSTIVSVMQAESSRPVRTFTIGSADTTLDESEPAHAVARHLGTEHTQLDVTAADALAVIPRLPHVYDEPFADSSQVPTLLLAELARRSVTVSLSGDGGDELFGGYDRYRVVPAAARRLGWLPGAVRRGAARTALAVPPWAWEAAVRPLPRRVRPPIPGIKVAKLAEIAPLEGPEAMYERLVSHWHDPDDVVLGSREPATIVGDRGRWPRTADLASRMMALDAVTYLPDDILVKLDRATMSVGLEARVPYLDHRLFELAASLPTTLKIRDGRGKWLLRQVLHRFVPARLVERPKTGFGVPIGAWLRGPLREWAAGLLEPRRLRREGYLHPEAITRRWDEHQRGRRDWEYHLWDVLMFQAWLEATAR